MKPRPCKTIAHFVLVLGLSGFAAATSKAESSDKPQAVKEKTLLAAVTEAAPPLAAHSTAPRELSAGGQDELPADN